PLRWPRPRRSSLRLSARLRAPYGPLARRRQSGSWWSARHLDREPRPVWCVFAGFYAAAVFRDNPAHNRQPQAAAAALRRIVGKEQLLAFARRDPRSVVGHDDANHAVAVVELRFDDDAAAAFDCFDGV